MSSSRDTGDGEAYSLSEEDALTDAVMEAYEQWDRATEPSGIDVRAQIEWAGTIMPANNGVRRTKLDGLSPGAMRKVREALAAHKAAQQRQVTAKPLTSLKAKGWHAQLKELTGNPHGSTAADKAGLNPNAATLRKWLADEDYPIRKSDRERIDRAYKELRDRPMREAGQATQKTAHKVATALTEALRERYGVNIRFRNIEHFKFE